MAIDKPNFTAWFVLQGLLAASHQRAFAHDINPEAQRLWRLLAGAVAKERFLSRLVCALPYDFQYKVGQMVTDSGRLRHFYLRKKMIEQQVRMMIENQSIQQLVVLGSGFDVLPMVLAPHYPAVNFIEIDMEGTQLFEQRILKENGITMPANIEAVVADLATPLPEVLARSSQFDPKKRTLFLAEGVFMFLPEALVARILASVRSLCTAGAQVLFTHLSKEPQNKASNYVIQSIFLNKEKSPFQWTISPSAIANFVQQAGAGVAWQCTYPALHEGYYAPAEALPSLQEHLVRIVIDAYEA